MSDVKRILIVGGVAGGASAAARARRLSESAEIVMFERGEHISFANCGLPYHIGGTIAQRERLLVQTPAAMKKRFNIDVRTRTEAVSINPAGRELTVRDLQTGQQRVETYDALILSPGAEPIRPKIPGMDSPGVFTLRTLGDMDAIKAVVDSAKPSRAVVVGGGYIGLEMAEALRARKLDVTLVELAGQAFGPIDPEMASLVHRQLRLHGVDLRLGASVTAIESADGQFHVRLSNGQAVPCGLVIMAIGVRPEVALARQAGLKLGVTGGIAVDEHMRTSDANIYAVGDAVEVTDYVSGQAALIPLAGPANRQGRIAADNVFGRGSTYKRTQGTAICKVFDIAVGMTGQSEKALKKAGASHEKVYVHSASHASYYPGASPIALKLLFDPQTGKILGTQAIGADGVDKRIDVLAVAIRAGMTVYDLADLELSYAPPYGSAKDVVNYAGFVAANVLRGDVKICHTPDMLSPRAEQLLLDVRTVEEVRAGTIPGAMNVPLDELRSRLGELPRDKELLVFCQAGLRGYVACRVLSQNGFACRNLSGGYLTFKAAAEMLTPSGGSGNSPGGANAAGAEVRKPLAVSPAIGEPSKAAPVNIAKTVDARGLQCPGPIMRVKQELSGVAAGQAISVLASDPAFAADIAGWCHSTGNKLLNVAPESGGVRATIVKGSACAQAVAGEACSMTTSKKKTMVVFSGDFDKAMAAFIIANGAAAMGSEVTMFFTFWGLNILRKPQQPPVSKNLIERMFGWMMPRGAEKLALSKMNMAGMGLAMIKGIMKKKNVPSLSELIISAQKSGVHLVACSMSMDLMGIKAEELLAGVEFGGVAMYLDKAEAGNVNLFI